MAYYLESENAITDILVCSSRFYHCYAAERQVFVLFFFENVIIWLTVDSQSGNKKGHGLFASAQSPIT